MNTLHVPTMLALPSHFLGTISALSWSSDSTRIAAASSRGSVAIWDVRTGTCVFNQQVARDRFTALAWTAQGRCLLLGSARGALSFLQVSSGEVLTTSSFPHPIARIAYAPNDRVERFLVVAGPLLRIFTAGQPHPITRRYATPILDAAWCPAGRSIALLTRHGLVEVWDVAAKLARFQAVLRNTPRCLAWGVTDQVFTVGTAQGHIQDYSLRTGRWEPACPLSRFPLAALYRGEQGIIAQSEGEMLLEVNRVRQALAPDIYALAPDLHGTAFAVARAGTIQLSELVSSLQEACA